MNDEDLEFNEKLQNLHARMLTGDVVAPSELAELVLPVLTERLSKRHPTIFDPHLIDIAVTDTLLNYFNHPDRYKSAEASLIGYLLMSANGDLLNLLKPKSVERKSIKLDEDVELRDSYAEIPVESSIAADDLNVEDAVLARLSPVASRIRELFSDPRDQELAEMLINGIRKTEEYGKVLGIDHLDSSDQQAIVKRHKDRIKKMIIRNIDPKELKDDK
jgi:hypothetical protein